MCRCAARAACSISITGGPDLTLYEVDEAATRIREEVDPEANIILGATFDDELEGTMRVSVVATGLAMLAADRSAHKDRESLSQRLAGLASVPAPAQAPTLAPNANANARSSSEVRARQACPRPS